MYLLGLEKLPPSPFAEPCLSTGVLAKAFRLWNTSRLFFQLPFHYCQCVCVLMRLDAKLDSIGLLWYLTYSYISITRYQFIQCITSIPCQATSSSPIFNDPCSGPNARQQCVARIELIIVISPRRPQLDLLPYSTQIATKLQSYKGEPGVGFRNCK